MQDDRATKIVEAIEMFLNDRKGFHVDCLENDIRNEFLGDLREVVQGKLTASPAEIRKGDEWKLPDRPKREHVKQFATALESLNYVQYVDFKRYADALEARIAELEATLRSAQ